MSKRLGKIVLVNKEANRVYILEIGPKGNLLECSLSDVACNDDDQYRQYPARIHDRIVQYEVHYGIVGKVQVLNLKQGFRSPLCKKCERRSLTMAAKRCQCGNVTNSMFTGCEVCALRANKCAMCDNPVS